ncbi:MAG: YkgJ family cysteine cluster protein [Thermodesulfobacteriota bacterium]
MEIPPPQLPENVTKIAVDEKFTFSCHPGVSCFTDCCRQLELALTPYDVLRLRFGTKMASRQLHDNYIIMEQESGEPFPRFYLTMVDDGRDSCVFVNDRGCTIYDHRPGACRAYPMGRGATRQADGTINDFHVLLKESHCRGFEESTIQDVAAYSRDQGLTPYNRFNDEVAVILQHEQIRQGMILSDEQRAAFILALYDLDTFRIRLTENSLPGPAPQKPGKSVAEDDETLLLFAIQWLNSFLYKE